MNEIFDFSRFWKYFKYDLLGNIREHKVKIATFLLAPVGFYFIFNAISFIFGNGWIPGTPYRVTLFTLLSVTFLLYYPVLCYGFLTDKRPASAWIMIPVSVTEKYVSMLLNVLIIVPVCYFAAYFVLDAFLCIFPNSGKPVISMITSGMGRSSLNINPDGPLTISLFSMSFLGFCEYAITILAFLLGGLCFKKNKVAKTILSMFVVSFAVMGIFILISWTIGSDMVDYLDSFFSKMDNNLRLFTFVINTFLTIFVMVPFLALGAGVYFRLKTIKH